MSTDHSWQNEEFIDSVVARGGYRSRGEALDDAVELLRRREELRAELKIGLEQLDRGEGEPHDMQEVKDEVRRRIGSEG